MDTIASAATPASDVIVYPDAAVTLALTCCIIFIVAGVAGNGLTIIALLNQKKLRSASTTTFIISLCVTDLIFCAFNLPLTAVRYYHRAWILGPMLCKLFPFIFYLNVAASLFNMMAITLNRYVLIAHYRYFDAIFSRLSVAVMIAICWGVPLALLTPTLFDQWGRFGYKAHTFSCTILRNEGKSPKKIFFLIGFLLPCIVILASYSGIFCIVRRSHKNVSMNGVKSPNGRSSTAVQSEKRSTEENTLTRMVVMIFCSFMICYLPLMLVNVFDDEETVPWIHVIASILPGAVQCGTPFSTQS